MIEELISRVFTDRNLAHLRHWSTDSLAEHMALGDFYDEVIEQADDLVEAYQGYFNKIGTVEVPAVSTPTDMISVLSKNAIWINKNRSEIVKQMPALENIIDSLEGVYLKALYKLRFLD